MERLVQTSGDVFTHAPGIRCGSIGAEAATIKPRKHLVFFASVAAEATGASCLERWHGEEPAVNTCAFSVLHPKHALLEQVAVMNIAFGSSRSPVQVEEEARGRIFFEARHVVAGGQLSQSGGPAGKNIAERTLRRICLPKVWQSSGEA